MNLRLASFAALLLLHSHAFAGSTGYAPQPVLGHTGAPVTTIGPISYTGTEVEPGGAIVVPATDGSYYVAVTNKIIKYGSNGVQIWSRQYSSHTVNVTGEHPYTLYYEDWGGGNDFQVGSGTDSGEVMGNLTPQKGLVFLDSIFFVFSDTSRPYRALVVSFDKDGDLLWRHVTSYPLADLSNGYYTGSGQQRYSTDLFLVSGSSGVVGVGVFESVSNGELYLTDLGQTHPASRISRVAIFKLEATTPGGNGEYLLNPVQFGNQNKNAYGVGATLRYTDTFQNYVVIATQEGPDGQPLAEADKLVFRTIPAPFTSVLDATHQIESNRDEEEWNDIAYRYEDDRLYLAGSWLVGTKPRQLAASFEADNFTPNWFTETVPEVPSYVTEQPSAPGSHVFVAEDGVTIAGEGTFALSKVDFEGDQLWTVNFPGMDDGSIRRAYAPVMDEEGSVFYTGVDSQTQLRIWKVSSGGIFQYQSIPFTAEANRLIYTGSTAAAVLPNGGFMAGMPTRQSSGSDPYSLTLNKITDTDVVKAPNEIFISLSTGSFTYKNNSFTYDVEATSGLPVTLSIVNGTAVVSGKKVTFNTAGNVTVRFTQAGNDSFEAAVPVDKVVEVRDLAVKAHQTISFGSIATKEFSVSPFSVSATASSRLAVSYSISGPASISGGRVTLKDLGTVRVTASQAGNGAYLAASSVTRSFAVRDTTDPRVTKVDTSGTSTKAKYSIAGEVSDNHRVKKIQYRVKAPGGTFGSFASIAVKTSTGGNKGLVLPIKTPTAGKYVVELQALDESGNKSSIVKVSIKKN